MSTKTKILLEIVLVIISILIGVWLLSSSSTTKINVEDKASTKRVRTVDLSLLVRTDSTQIKSENSKVSIVEFIDFESASCRGVHPIVQKILKDYEGKVNFTVRYYSQGSNSVLASKAAEAAGIQGKYWDMFDILLGKQLEWINREEPQTVVFSSYAQEIGLDLALFKKDMDSKELEDKVMRDKDDGKKAGIEETPTFFINGMLVGYVLSYDEIKQVIDSEMSK